MSAFPRPQFLCRAKRALRFPEKTGTIGDVFEVRAFARGNASSAREESPDTAGQDSPRKRGRRAQSASTDSVTENRPPARKRVGKGEKARQELTAPEATREAGQTQSGARQNRRAGGPSDARGYAAPPQGGGRGNAVQRNECGRGNARAFPRHGIRLTAPRRLFPFSCIGVPAAILYPPPDATTTGAAFCAGRSAGVETRSAHSLLAGTAEKGFS